MFDDGYDNRLRGMNPAFVKQVWAKRREDLRPVVVMPKPRQFDDIDRMLKSAVEKYGRIVTPRERLRIDVEAVAQVYGLSYADLVSKGQTHLITKARSAAMWMLKFTRDMSLPEIGRLFNMDHTAVLASINRHVARIDPNDPRAAWAERKRAVSRMNYNYDRKTERPYARQAA